MELGLNGMLGLALGWKQGLLWVVCESDLILGADLVSVRHRPDV